MTTTTTMPTTGVTTYDRDGNVTTSYEGCVLALRDSWNSSMDITSFYAVVWDREAQDTRDIFYASDYDPYHHNGRAVVDATPEVKAEVLAHFEAKAERQHEAWVSNFVNSIAKGDTIEVTGGRKYKGLTGQVFWVGEAEGFGRRNWVRRVGFDHDGERLFVDAHQATITTPHEGKADAAEADFQAHKNTQVRDAVRAYDLR